MEEDEKDTQHYKGHENQNYNELSPPTIKIAIIKKTKNNMVERM